MSWRTVNTLGLYLGISCLTQTRCNEVVTRDGATGPDKWRQGAKIDSDKNKYVIPVSHFNTRSYFIHFEKIHKTRKKSQETSNTFSEMKTSAVTKVA